MKSLSKFAALAAGVSTLALVAFNLSPVYADSPGQLQTGSATYEVKDITQNGSYGQTISANPGDELEYSIELHNTEFGTLYNIQVNVNLPNTSSTTNTSTVTATPSTGASTGTNGTATVNLSSAQSISYESGTGVLFDANGNVIEKLPDTLTNSGVNVGNLNGSTTEYVNFKAKVNSPAPQPTYTCNVLNVTTESNRTVKVTNFSTTQNNGASFTNASINWGDNSSATSTNPVGETHQYGQDGTYTIVATANFSVNGNSATATSNTCKQSVTFASTTPPAPTTPAKPTQLVNTGPGSVVGIFGATTVLGAVAHRLFGRRLAGLFTR